MIYIIDTDKIKAKAYERIVDIKSGAYKDCSVKDVIKATEMMLDIVTEYGVSLEDKHEISFSAGDIDFDDAIETLLGAKSNG